MFPLPYGFTTGTHGSGERAAMASSRENVYISFRNPRDDSGIIPVLGLGIKAPLLTPGSTVFTLDEVESIAFTDKNEFTPYVDDRDGKYVLTEKGNSITYYLRFRDFSNYRGSRERENLREINDKEWEVIGGLNEPGAYSNLWNEDYETHKLDGFVVLWSEKPEEMTLYELKGVNLPKRDPHEANAVLAAQILRRDAKILPHVKEYKGDEVIKRLVEVPVEERRF